MPSPDISSPTAPSQDYLTIALEDDIFALPVDCVREVLDPPPMTAVPMAPAPAPGLVNVRGNVMALFDLRTRFGMAQIANGETTRLVIAHVAGGGDPFLVALRADAVHEVIDIPPGTLRPAPPGSTSWPAALMRGVIQRGDRYVIVLDLDEIVATEPDRTT